MSHYSFHDEIFNVSLFLILNFVSFILGAEEGGQICKATGNEYV